MKHPVTAVSERMRTNELIANTTAKWRRKRTQVFDHELPLSWLRVVGSIVTYLLLCSDIFRSGVGIQKLSQYPSLEPDTYEMYGPWAYPVMTVSANDSQGRDVPVWSYKFDTTSIIWRAFALYYNSTTFPDCLLYQRNCDEEAFERSMLFRMMDELVTSTVAFANPRKQRLEPTSVTIRSLSVFKDTFHHLLVPQLFLPPFRRTNQAIHYSAELLERQKFPMCSTRGTRPSFCYDLWSNFYRSCSIDDPADREVGHVANHIQQRYYDLRAARNDATEQVDMLVLASTEDFHLNIGGVARQLCRYYDVTTIMRVRSCNANGSASCETIYVEDYRYEGGIYGTQVRDWFVMVAVLRCVAQAYCILRLVMLFAGTYAARRQEDKYTNANVRTVVFATLNVIARLPCHGIVYGSPLPTIFYAIAHAIDAPMTYRILYERFMTLGGSGLAFDYLQLAMMCAIQMRNVWLLALGLQLGVYVRTARSWSLPSGVRGLSEFSLSIVSAVTIVAQYRSNSFRDTNVLRVYRVPERKAQAVRNWMEVAHRSAGSVIREGVIIDLKCLVLFLLIWWASTFVIWCGLSLRLGRRRRPMGILSSRTPVPYSAGLLWPTVAISIYWNASVFPVSERTPRASQSSSWVSLRRWTTTIQRSIRKIRPLQRVRTADMGNIGGEWPAELSHRLKYARYQLEGVHERRSDAQAVAAFINLFAMTDLITFWNLRLWRGIDVAYFLHEPTGTICCLPLKTRERDRQSTIPWQEMKLLRVLSSRDMAWADLLNCG
ncbi:TPA: hypothetical protein N0F65_003676 [Lagenidium giganteum]|uniref:Uncharacterized protein n=1 Tax=Lagenidium giganteum TaxID=4803 RepID=A0AAV2YQN9_9STRA|nr:TPA: hypothetical protein N0F65_003676 [Lagenidium giganteum]